MAQTFRARALFLLLFAAASTLLISGCTAPVDAGANPRIPAPSSAAVLRSGDSLTIALQGVPDASTNNVQINEQGFVSLPYIGNVTAAGLTVAQLSQGIRDTYLAKKIYTMVEVSVVVTQRYVYVGGEVMRPGRIEWTPDLTVAKAIEAAGGFSLYAKQTRITLVREGAAYGINVVLAQKNPAEDPPLMPGDSLQVPRSPF
ncbi:MAG TPA: polysaccharide biosynthesis/export family protein [Opitutaceae bacterium]|nr:polysaccharide biosynthesis/export family protein [Opitutaceae bacterium]